MPPERAPLFRAACACTVRTSPCNYFRVCCLSCVLLACGCRPAESVSPPRAIPDDPSPARASTPVKTGTTSRKTETVSPAKFVRHPTFRDVCEPAGLSFVYDNGATGKVLMVESIGGGCGWLDFDCDGAPDLYLCQGGNPAPTDATPQPRDQLFRNLADGRFVPVTEGAGIAETRYSQGVAVGISKLEHQAVADICPFAFIKITNHVSYPTTEARGRED